MRLAACCAFLASLCAPGVLSAAENEAWAEVRLDTGESVSAPLLHRDGKRVVLDMAGQVIALPAERVTGITEGTDAGDARPEAHPGALYAMGKDRRVRALEEQVAATQGAVVCVETPAGLGSGFFVSPRGHLVTNVHVVERETRVAVIQHIPGDGGLAKRRLSGVRIIALAPLYDLALLQAPEVEGPYPTVPLGDMSRLERGQVLYAIGNPLGLERTVTKGILSVLDRSEGGLRYLQTTVEVNPGNSGGPLFNMAGEVVGVINAKIMFAEGLAFAIPGFYIRDFLDNTSAYLYDEKNANTGVRYIEAPFSKDPHEK